MAIYYGTRYARTEVYKRNGNTPLLGVRSRVRFNLENASYYTWVQGDTIDGVAQRIYNDSRLWWAIMDANPTLITELEIVPGMVLAVPDYEEVLTYL